MALDHTFDELSEVRFELDDPITGQSGQQWPCFWVTGHTKAEIESALGDDPTVDGFESVTSRDDAFLYDFGLSEDGGRLRDIIQEEDGTILVGSGAHGQWELKLCFGDTDDLSRLHDRLTEEGITLEVRQILKVTEDCEDTETHRDIFETALQDGYFDMPRETTLEEFATEMGISEQTLSNRLQQGYENVLEAEVDEPPGMSDTDA